MRIIVDKLTGVVKYMGNGTYLSETGVTSITLKDPTTTTANAFEVEVEDPPKDLEPWLYKFVIGQLVYNVESNIYSAKLDLLKEELCDRVDELRKQKVYSDIAATFPDGEKVIQFRDEVDRANLSNVAQNCQLLVAAGAPDTLVPYRAADNVTQYPAAQQMLMIAVGVMISKQSIVSVSWDHKDAIRLMTTLEEVYQYDITTGW